MPARTGGTATHKPDCGCAACQRKAKTLALPAGKSGGFPSLREAERPEPLDASIDPSEILHAPGRTPRDRIAQWIQLKHQEPGITSKEVAARIGIAAPTLYGYITKARREGWLQMTDPLERIEYEIIPQTLDNIAFYLSKEGGRDKQITLETAKATIYKQFTDSKGISEVPNTVLALKIETAPSGDEVPTTIIAGTIVGKARVLELAPRKLPAQGPTDQEIL